MNAGALLVRARQVVTPAGVLEDATVRVESGSIVAVDRTARLPADEGALVLEGDVLLPGFIDLHIHGFGGHSFAGGAEDVRAALQGLGATGVTTCCAGLGAGPTLEAIAHTIAGVAALVGETTGGARLAGVFMEGPFISVEKRGAWNPEHLRHPSVAEMRELISASGGTIRRFNVAPELPGAHDFIRAARDEDIVVSLGHSNATYEQAIAGIEAGATVANHTYNAMSGLGHRAPGLVGAVLGHDTLLAELILDGVHVHPGAARALYRARGPEGVALITDGSPMTGMPDGVYDSRGRTLVVEKGACRLPDGTLAGGVSTFDRNLRNALDYLGPDLPALAALSSGNAARALGIDGRTGRIATGLDADLVLLDGQFMVVATIVGGDVVYRREE